MRGTHNKHNKHNKHTVITTVLLLSEGERPFPTGAPGEQTSGSGSKHRKTNLVEVCRAAASF